MTSNYKLYFFCINMLYCLENCEFSTLNKKRNLKTIWKKRKHTKFTVLIMFLFAKANNNVFYLCLSNTLLFHDSWPVIIIIIIIIDHFHLRCSYYYKKNDLRRIPSSLIFTQTTNDEVVFQVDPRWPTVSVWPDLNETGNSVSNTNNKCLCTHNNFSIRLMLTTLFLILLLTNL